MILFLIQSIFLSIGLINCSELEYKDCASEPSLHVRYSMIPHPMIFPRDTELNITLKILKDISVNNTKVKFSLKKTSPKVTNIKCYFGYGSCSHDYCQTWRDVYKSTPNTTLIPVCPSKVGEYFYENTKLTAPKGYIMNIFKSFIKGNFEVEMNVYNEVSKEVYGCTQFNFTVNLDSNYKWDDTDEPFFAA